MEWESALFHTEDNEVYLHSVGIVSLTLTTTIGAKYTDAVKNTGLGYCITVFPLIVICYMYLLEPA